MLKKYHTIRIPIELKESLEILSKLHRRKPSDMVKVLIEDAVKDERKKAISSVPGQDDGQ